MVLTFGTFNLNGFIIYFIGWTIKGYTTSGCKDKGIETSEFANVTIELISLLVCCFIQCYLQRVRLNSVFLIFITISEWFLIYFLYRCPKKHVNSVNNSISSLLWISIGKPDFKSHNIFMSARVYFENGKWL